MDINKLFFELIRVAIGNQECLSRTPSAAEWQMLYDIPKKQSLVGICFAGVQRLQKQEQTPPEMLYLQWIGMAAKIQQRNELVNRQCVEVQKKIEGDGFRTYIMKGQGNAALYTENLSMLRQSGDIDIYLEGGLDKVLAYARTFGEVTKVNELEMSVPVYKDTEVEFHYRPFIMRNPFKNRKLQQFFKDQMDRKFSNSQTCGEHSRTIIDSNKYLSIEVPSLEFNLIHLMVHIYHHLFTEGIGFRQLMDYYFLTKKAFVDNGNHVERECLSECLKKEVHELGMDRFASALMWVLREVFGMSMINVPWVPSEKDGRVLLDEVMLSGNFGKQDERMEGLYDSKWNTFWMVNMKTFRFWRFDHWAWFWSPVWRVYHFIWKRINGFTK